MKPLEEIPVVTCFLRNRGDVLLLRRSEKVGSYRGKWGGVAGYAEGAPEEAALREIAEETGLVASVELVRRGEPFPVEDHSLHRKWIVHPFLFDCGSRDFKLDRESTEAEWVSPTEILRRDTVPELWTSYLSVAPTVETVNRDSEHGSAYISIRALEVLRDRAALLDQKRVAPVEAWKDLAATALRLLTGHPFMAVLVNRVNRVMHLSKKSRSAEAVEKHARSSIDRAGADDEGAARQAARLVAERRVLTLSGSGTVMAALRAAAPSPVAVAVAESRPGGEGASVAEALGRRGLPVTLLPDSALCALLTERRFDLVLVGADSLLPSGAIVNKVGSCGAALAARQAGIPFYVASATDKIQLNNDVQLPQGDPKELYNGGGPIETFVPIFEVVPAGLVTSVLTERGVLKPEDLRSIASQMEKLADWRNG